MNPRRPLTTCESGSVVLMPGQLYPVWRLVIIGAGLLVAIGLYLLVGKTRVGMLVRAGATNAPMVIVPSKTLIAPSPMIATTISFSSRPVAA